jgi:hypothetical protein
LNLTALITRLFIAGQEIQFGMVTNADTTLRGLKAWVCGRSLAGIASSIPAGGRGCSSFKCCVFSGRGFCDGPIPRPKDSYRLCVSVCVSLSVIRCNNDPLYLQRVVRKRSDRQKRKIVTN